VQQKCHGKKNRDNVKVVIAQKRQNLSVAILRARKNLSDTQILEITYFYILKQAHHLVSFFVLWLKQINNNLKHYETKE